MQPRKTPTYVLFLLLSISIQACNSNSAHENKVEVRPTEVKIIKAFRGDIYTEIHATGTILPKHESYIGPKVSGRIEKFYADEGDFVQKGNPLLSLEQVRFKLAFSEAQAAHKENLAQLKNMELKLERKKVLFEKGIIDREIYDDIATEVELTRARVDTSRPRLDRAEENLKDSILYAPFTGFVVEKKMNTGEIFSGVSNEYVFHLVDTGTVRVEVNIFETKKRYVKTGQIVSVSVDAIPGKMFEGEITVVIPLIDAASRKFLVKIELANQDFRLESGMFARVRIPEKKRMGTLLVPAGAVVERDAGKVVFVANDALTASEKNVGTGLMTPEHVEILSGIEEGDRIIIEGIYAVRDGTPLIINE